MDYEEDLNEPIMIYSGNKDSMVRDYFINYDETTLYGFSFSNVPLPLIDNAKPNHKSYQFEVGGREHSLNYWWIAIDGAKEEHTISY